jgi:hypothetical protein
LARPMVLPKAMPSLLALALVATALPALALLQHAPAPQAAQAHAPAAAAHPATAAADALPARIRYMPTIPQAEAQRALQAAGYADSMAGGSPLLYHGGPITKVPHVVLVFWGFHTTGVSTIDDPAGEEAYLTSFFSHVGGSYWAGIQTQYTESARGAITNPAVQFNAATDVIHDDPPAGLPAVVPDVLLASEAVNAADAYRAAHGYDQDVQFLIATPHERNTAEFGTVYCAYHTTTTDSASRDVAYTNLPYMTDMGTTCGSNFAGGGALDGVSIVAGHEFEETVTDPLLNAWYDSSGQENGDKCAWLTSGPGHTQLVNFGGTNFAVQGLWSNAISDCDI